MLRLKIKAQAADAFHTATHYFWAEATIWDNVKQWISQRISVPTTCFHLVRAMDGAKMNYDDPIGDQDQWAVFVVVLKET